MFKIQLFCGFITQLVKKLQQWSFYEVIEDPLPFVLNTKRPMSDIWLLRCKQNSFGCFCKKRNVFRKHPKLQPNIVPRPFCIQNERHPLSPHIKTIAVAFLQAE